MRQTRRPAPRRAAATGGAGLTGRAAPGDLRAYAAKRDFTLTPEPPPGGVQSRAGAATFMVHKHHARRLHYDLRLEIDGMLASWAIPKGPSYDPRVKRLAVQTEDHPLEYASFEGRIPDGQYGAGDSLIWDRGRFDTVPPEEASAQRRKGHLHVELRGDKLRGRWHLVRTGRSTPEPAQWLLFKAADETADPGYDVVTARPESMVSGRAQTRGPARAGVRDAGSGGTGSRGPRATPDTLLARVFPPMLATSARQLPPALPDWHLEPKYDGFRALCAVSGGQAAIWSRNRLDLRPRAPRVSQGLAALDVREAVIDGELVALDARGVPRFEWLQGGHDEAVTLVAFDLLWLDGEDLRARPIEARRDFLGSVLHRPSEAIRLSERFETEPTSGPSRTARPARRRPGPLRAGGDPLGAARARGFEGVVAKRRRSTYRGGRSGDWLKVKTVATQEVVIVGFTPHRRVPDTIGALVVGVVEHERLVFVGKVGTGFSAAQRRALRRELAGDVRRGPAVIGAPEMPDTVWVRPRLVGEVAFTEWTSEGRLRHPSFRGLRPDKAPSECRREGAVSVALTHADRVLYPRDGITKQDVADYFARAAGPLLRALAGRPLALEHFSRGIDRPPWFRQGIDAPEPWMTLVETPTRAGGRTVRHLVADRPETLRWLAQHAALTLHMWSARAPDLEAPDWVVFDLDPAEGARRGIGPVVEAALILRGLFDKLGLPSVPKTSGRRGLHILVPLGPGHTHEAALAFARRIGTAVAQALPEVTVERSRGRRRGRLYLDCLQNGYGKTIVAPYALRGRDGAPVSAPLAWSEVTPRLDPSRYTLRTMPRRLDEVGDLFAPALGPGAHLPRLG